MLFYMLYKYVLYAICYVMLYAIYMLCVYIVHIMRMLIYFPFFCAHIGESTITLSSAFTLDTSLINKIHSSQYITQSEV